MSLNRLYSRALALTLIISALAIGLPHKAAPAWWSCANSSPTPTPTPSYDTIIINDTPAGFWPLKDNSGSTSAVDLSGQNHNCTTAGTAPTFGVTGTTTDGETAASFTAGWLSCPMPAPTISNTSGVTIEFLYKATSGPVGIIDTAPGVGGSIRNLNSDAIGPQNTAMDITIGGTGAWHLIDYLLAFDSAGGTVIAYLYKDGATVSIGGATPTGHNGAGGRTVPVWANPMVWGAINTSCGTACYTGSMQKLAVYKYWLTPTQIQKHFTAISQ
jgi:hypothetical protein